MNSRTASNIAIYIAIILFFLSWFLPAVSNAPGFFLMLTAIFMHIIILPVLVAFPVWANFTFLWALRYFYDKSICPEIRREKGLYYGLVTVCLMIIGVTIRIDNILIGTLVWPVSGFFLLCGLYIEKLSALRAYLILSALITSIATFSFLLYQHEKEKMQHQIHYKKSDWYHVFFQPKVMDAKLLEEAMNISPSDGEMNSSFSVKDLGPSDIEVKFNALFPALEKSSQNPTDCNLASDQQHYIHYPLDYVEDGYQWQQYFLSGGVSIGHPTDKKANIIYQAQNIDEKYTELKIFRRDNQQVLYKQKLLRNVNGRNCYYEPKINPFLERIFAEDKETNVNAYEAWGGFTKSETLKSACEWKELSHNKYEFEGKRINFMDQKMYSSQLLCSENYMAVVYAAKESWGDVDRIEARVYQRNNLQPIQCGVLYYFSLEDQNETQFYERKVTVEQLEIKDIPDDGKCPYVEILLDNGAKDSFYNYSNKNPS